MRRRTRRDRSARTGRERGAVIVELAMVVPLLIVLALGIVDYGTLFTDKISLKGGVREAVWNGGRQIWGSALDCGLTGVTPTANPAGDANTERLMCMTKTRTELEAEQMRVMVKIVNIESPATPGVYAPGAGIMVCAMRQAHSVTGFYGFVLNGTVQKSRLVGLVQNATAPGITDLSETPFPGQSWAFCDPTQPATT